jgi:hypothetical protein
MDYEFTAYIDEAGDEGLKTVRPIDPNGASEWFVLSAVIIRRSAEPRAVQLVRDLLVEFKSHQRPHLHFRDLLEFRKQRLCEAIAQAPLRSIVVASHKPNMRQYRNERAERMLNRNYFYCWVTRLLLERVTSYCRDDALSHDRPIGKVRIVFSNNGGLSYPQLRVYFDRLRDQSRSKNLWLPKGDLAWDVYDRRLVGVQEHDRVAGLQLADACASAFYQALETTPGLPLRPNPARALKPIIARKSGSRWDFGLKMMPYLRPGMLPDAQLEFLNFFKS